MASSVRRNSRSGAASSGAGQADHGVARRHQKREEAAADSTDDQDTDQQPLIDLNMTHTPPCAANLEPKSLHGCNSHHAGTEPARFLILFENGGFGTADPSSLERKRRSGWPYLEAELSPRGGIAAAGV